MKNTVHRIKTIKQKKAWGSVSSTMLAAVLVSGMLIPTTVNADEAGNLATQVTTDNGIDLTIESLTEDTDTVVASLRQNNESDIQSSSEKKPCEGIDQNRDVVEVKVDLAMISQVLTLEVKEDENSLREKELKQAYEQLKEYECRQQDYQYQQNNQHLQEGEHTNSENSWKDIDDCLKQIEQELRQNLENVESHESLEYLDYFGPMQTASLDNAESIENDNSPAQNEDFWEVINKRLKQIEQLLQQKFDKGQPLSSEELAFLERKLDLGHQQEIPHKEEVKAPDMNKEEMLTLTKEPQLQLQSYKTEQTHLESKYNNQDTEHTNSSESMINSKETIKQEQKNLNFKGSKATLRRIMKKLPQANSLESGLSSVMISLLGALGVLPFLAYIIKRYH